MHFVSPPFSPLEIQANGSVTGVSLMVWFYLLTKRTSTVGAIADAICITKGFETMLNTTESILGGTLPDTNVPESLATGRFVWADYLVFLITLLVSVGIGIFHGCYGGKQSTSSEYLLGSRQMGYVPMSLSLTTGFLSAISMLGNPAEMYNYGSQYWLSCLGFFFVAPITSYLFLPVFTNLRLTSAYQYLNMRFNKVIGSSISFMFVIQTLLYSSCIVYAPALALTLVTGISVYMTVIMVYVVCIFYTSVGGIKAVIWSDSFQTAVLIGSTLALIIRGTMEADSVWLPSLVSGRIELFNMDSDITTRHTFWNVTIGAMIFWISMYSTNQASVQRQLAVASLSDARKGLWLTAFLLALIYSMLFYLGMLVYSKYRYCDPLSIKSIQATDQILPLFVMDTMSDLPGVPGLFVAGIFSASLSSVAASLNSLAAVAVKDFVVGFLGKQLTEFQEATVSKIVCIVFGVLSFGLVFFIEKLGSVLQVTLSFNGMVCGIIMGVFILGMYFPWTNNKGAFCGAIVGLAFNFWVGFGAQLATAEGQIVTPRKPLSVEGCEFNATLYEPVPTSEPFPLYKISYLWYSPIGALITVMVGILVSLCTKPQDPQLLDPNLVADLTKWTANKMPKSWRKELNLPFYATPEVVQAVVKSNAQSTETIATIDTMSTIPVE